MIHRLIAALLLLLTLGVQTAPAAINDFYGDYQTRLVVTSTPITALTTTSAPSTTRSAA